MTTISSVVGLDRTHAGVAWGLLTGIFAVGGVNLLLGSPAWALLAGLMAAIGLVPPLAHGDRKVTPPWVPLGVAASTLVAGTIGIGGPLTYFLAIASVALLLGVVVETTTAVEMTPTFAVIFVALATMASAGLWTVGEWAVDTLFATSFLGDRARIARTLAVATLAGVGAGILFEFAFRVSETNRTTPVSRADS